MGIQKGVIRQLPGRPDTLIGAKERVTIEQMIEAATINEAYQLLCEDRLGSITVGKDADFLVFDNDLLTAEHEGFSYNEPRDVYFAGKKVN